MESFRVITLQKLNPVWLRTNKDFLNETLLTGVATLAILSAIVLPGPVKDASFSLLTIKFTLLGVKAS